MKLKEGAEDDETSRDVKMDVDDDESRRLAKKRAAARKRKAAMRKKRRQEQGGWASFLVYDFFCFQRIATTSE